MFSGKVIQISHSIFQQAIDNQTLRCKFYFGLEFGQDLEYILNWLRANKLTLNMTKNRFYTHRFMALLSSAFITGFHP